MIQKKPVIGANTNLHLHEGLAMGVWRDIYTYPDVATSGPMKGLSRVVFLSLHLAFIIYKDS